MIKYSCFLMLIFLSGCVAFPHKNISVPGFNVSITDKDVTKVYLSTGSPLDEYSCSTSTEMVKVNDNYYKLNPEYSWIDIILLIPAHCVITVFICGLTDKGEAKQWQNNIGVFCNKIPTNMDYNCGTFRGSFKCESRT